MLLDDDDRHSLGFSANGNAFWVNNSSIGTKHNFSCFVLEDDFAEKDHESLQKTLNILTSNGVAIIHKSNIHQKFAIMDQKIVWYGSINLLSYGNAQESIMRIESSNIANELLKSIEKA